MTDAPDFRIVESETAYRGWLSVRRVLIAPPDGEPFRREIEDHGEAAVVLPYDPERRTALLVRLPRAPLIESGEVVSVEAPAGMLDGDDPQTCARREAMEEVGVRLGALEPVGVFVTMPAISTERLHLFLAPYTAADRVGAGGGLAEESEHITVLERPLPELAGDVEAGRLRDMKTAFLVTTLRLRRPDLFA